jgi:peptidoglycan/LPS O-acetylase OafA/YrhL
MTATAPPKLAFIEGMRGIAACQVVLLHYCAALLPVLARVGGASHFESEQALARSPLFALIDGYSAVYLFFVMSGLVLAGSFLRAPGAFAPLAAKRLLRLLLPVAVAFAFAIGVLLFAALPQSRPTALQYAGSDWLAALGHNSLSAALLRDGLLNSMLVGYQGSSIFAGAPTWTLHAEFWGSMLVLALAYRRLPPAPFWCGFAALAMVLGTSHFSLFLLGFFLFTQHTALLAARTLLPRWGGVLLLVPGLAVWVAKDSAALAAVDAAARAFGVVSAQSDFHWQSQAGAAPMFIGAVLSEALRRSFPSAPAQWLGKLSYALAVAASLIAGFALTFAAAVLFERHVDRAVAWSRRMSARPAPLYQP